MIYNVKVCNVDGSGVAVFQRHNGAPCWGRISTGYIALHHTRRLHSIEWQPILRYMPSGIVDLADASKILNLFIELFNDFDEQGNPQFTVEESRDRLLVTINLFNFPRAVTMHKMFMIRNVLEYIGNGTLFKYLIDKKIPARWAFYVGAAAYVSVGAMGVNMGQINQYMNDAQTHSSNYRWSDLRRYLYPPKGTKRCLKEEGENRLWKESHLGYAKGTISSSSFTNPKPPHNAGRRIDLNFTNWVSVNRFLSTALRREVDVTPV